MTGHSRMAVGGNNGEDATKCATPKERFDQVCGQQPLIPSMKLGRERGNKRRWDRIALLVAEKAWSTYRY